MKPTGIRISEPNSPTVATSGNRTHVSAGEILQQQQMDGIANSKALGDMLQNDSAQQLDCNATGNTSTSVGDPGKDTELVKQSKGIKNNFATDGDRRTAQCNALQEKKSVAQHENMEIAASKLLTCKLKIPAVKRMHLEIGP